MKLFRFVLIIICCLHFVELQAQVFGEIFDKDRSKKRRELNNNSSEGYFKTPYDYYNYEAYMQQLQEENQNAVRDSIDSLRTNLLTSPSELKKLGVPDSLISQLVTINALQDSLSMVQDSILNYRNKDKKPTEDSLNIEDIKKILDKQKKAILEKALSLPAAYVYGQEYFRRNSVRIIRENELKIYPPDNYILGEGDQLNITLWGRSDFNGIFGIDAYGSIELPLVGKIFLEGLTFTAAKKLIAEKVAQFYPDERNKLEINVTYSRMVSVNVVGEVFNPGTYRFPAINSVFNILVAMEGPNQLGSVRHIFVKRNGETVKELDLYQYLLNPNSKEDYFLANNDYILIPPLGKVVNLSGEVRRPYNYELKEKEGINELLEYCGGLLPNAVTKNINIRRFENNRQILISLNLDSLRQAKGNFLLANGDSIFVAPIPNAIRNYITLDGAVRIPGQYQWSPNMRISDALYRAEGPIEEADFEKAYLIRLNDDLSKKVIPFNLKNILLNQSDPQNIALSPLDTIKVLSLRERRQNFIITITGEVKLPGEYEFAEGMTIGDLIDWSGGFKREAGNSRLEISRIVQFDNATSAGNMSERITMRRMIIDSNLQLSEDDTAFELKPYDRVSVRLSPDFEVQQKVLIYGEILYPGEYSLTKKDETIFSLIERAGGLSQYAYKEATKLYRDQHDIIYRTDEIINKKKNDSLALLLIDLDDVLRRPKKSKFNYILTDADSIYVPKLLDMVTLEGAIGFFERDSIGQISVPFIGKKSAKTYIKKYGAGFGRFAKEKRTYVQQPNGKVERAQSFLFFRKYPKVQAGATVFVDLTDRKKNEKYRMERNKNRNWNDAFDGLTSKIATILTILVLVQQSRN